MEKAYEKYEGNVCTQTKGPYCSAREMAYKQWLTGEVTKNPPGKIPKGNSVTELPGGPHYGPEMQYYFHRKGKKAPELTLE